MSELKALIKNRVRACNKSGAMGESKLWQSALDRIAELEKYNLDLANESHNKSVRIKELEQLKQK